LKVLSVNKLNDNEKEDMDFYDIVGVEDTQNFLVNFKDDNQKKFPQIISHNCGILDEVEFVSGADANMLKSKIMKIYRTVKRRMESRFLELGEMEGMLFLVSSKKSKHDFLERYAKKVKDKDFVKVIEASLWEAKPKKRYSGETMRVAVGNKYLTSKILEPGEDESVYISQGYDIIDVPVEHRDAFELDINAALMDIAGISIASTTKYIYGQRLKNCTDETRENPFNVENVVISFDDTSVDLKDYLDLDKVHVADRRKPCFAHIDTSKNGDRTGLSLVAIEGTTKTKRLENGEVFEVTDLMYKVVLALTLEAAQGSQIPFYKIREFYYYLRDELNFNIRGISCDGYESVDMIQQFKLHGFEANTISMDRTSEPYSTLRTAINEGRFNTFKHSILNEELSELEEDKLNDKIDHPEGGSKDLSDAVAGAVYNASIHEDAKGVVEKSLDMDKILEVLGEVEKDDRNSFAENLEGQIAGQNRKVINSARDFEVFRENKARDDYIEELLN